jgi:hypothetical protein
VKNQVHWIKIQPTVLFWTSKDRTYTKFNIICQFCCAETRSRIKVLKTRDYTFLRTPLFLQNAHIIKQDRRWTYNIKLKRIRVTIFCRGKAISITYSECIFVALFTQHLKRMRHVTLSPVACLGLPYFPRYLINGTIFEKKIYWT